MKTARSKSSVVTAIVLMAVFPCLGQEIHITKLTVPSGRLEFTLTPAGTAYDYSCSVEWRSTLSSGNWTNVWHQPFVPFAQSNGMFSASIPRFFRLRCSTGQITNPPPVNYTVTGVVPSQITDGLIWWASSGNTNLIYYVEQATGTNGPWLSQWIGATNLHALATVTNSFNVPLFFRVVTITDSGELPW